MFCLSADYDYTMSTSSIKRLYTQILPLDSPVLIDIFAVYNGVHPQISKWIDLLTQQTAWETDIHAEFNYPDLFRHFYFENKSIQKTQGQHTFGFGFPMLFDTEGEDIISAPLFIWYLNIKPHPNRGDSWLISFEEGGSVAINEYLLAHISKKYDINLKSFFTDIAHKRPLTRAHLEAFCEELHTRLGSEEAFQPSLKACPKVSDISTLAQTPTVVMCGALGLFPHQESSVSPNIFNEIEFKNFSWTADLTHEFAILPEDAHQRAALRAVLRNKIVVVEGSRGTGKTHLATNILLNALSNGQKVAAIAHDMSSLIQIQNEFVKLGLGHLTFLLKDIYQDKKLLLDIIRNEQSGRSVDYKEDEFKITLKQARRFLAQSDDSHAALSRPIFGDVPFSEVVGYYLKSQPKAGRELLANHLNAADYDFSLKEYEILKAAIEEAVWTFKSVNTLKHPLSHLHPSVFEGEKNEERRTGVTQSLSHFIEKWKALHHRYIAVYDTYAQKLMHYYESHYTDLTAQIRLLKESYSDYKFQFGEAFESNNFFRLSGLRAASLFSDRSKNVLSAKDEAIQQYTVLASIFNERKHFKHDFLSQSDKKDFKKLQTNLETFELSLKGWRKALPATLQEELQRLNSKTAQHFDKDLAEEIAVLETHLEQLSEMTNERKIVADALAHKMLTLPKRMLFIEDTIEKLEDLKLNMRDFESFYDWQRYWLRLPENGKKVIQSLIKVKPNDWVAAFNSWYFHNTLVANYQTSALDNDNLMAQMCEAEDKLRTLLPAQIAHVWNERKKESIRALKSQNTEGYKLLFSSKNQELAKKKYLKEIINSYLPTLTDIYPVLLTTPSVATQWVEAEGKEFDLVVFDNAQNWSLDEIMPILPNTEGGVILSEYSKSDEPVPHSLVSTAQKQDAVSVRLNYLHRPVSQWVQSLNQFVFCPDLEVPFNTANISQSIAITHVKGKYNERSQSNEAEINGIIQLLEDIHATPFNTFPRIGIVCMNKKQRNALSNVLLHIVQKTLNGWEKIEQLQRNGLGIYTLDEIEGLQFDILIMSGTFESLDKIALSKKELRKAFNCFTQKFHYFNSVPQEDLLAASEEQHHAEGTFLLANLLVLAENMDKNTSEVSHIIEKLKSLYTSPKQYPASVFIEQVKAHLSHFIQTENIKENYFIDNHVFPLVIKKEDKTVVVRIDGKLIEGNYFSPTWEQRILKELQQKDISVISIWSYNWWKNPKGEAEDLALKMGA